MVYDLSIFTRKIALIFILILAVVFGNKSMARNLNLRKIEYKADTLTTPELINFLQQMNVSSFYDKPVDSFLLAIDANLYNMKIYGGNSSQGAHFRASYIVVDFTPDRGGPEVKIYVRE